MAEGKKSTNYSEALAAQVVEAYEACDSDESREACVQALSIETGKTVRSLRMKLVNEGVYQKAAYVTKAGTKAETKSAVVESIAAILGITSEQLPGLDKATKKALNVIRTAFVDASQAIVEAEAQADEAEEIPAS
jgi:hypothetical protein